MKKEKGPRPVGDPARQERLAQALRENLARRKAQAREREAAEGDAASDQDLSRDRRVQ